MNIKSSVTNKSISYLNSQLFKAGFFAVKYNENVFIYVLYFMLLSIIIKLEIKLKYSLKFVDVHNKGGVFMKKLNLDVAELRSWCIGDECGTKS